MASLCLLKCMDSHSVLMADGHIFRDLSFIAAGHCFQISANIARF